MSGFEWLRLATVLMRQGYRLQTILTMDDEALRSLTSMSPRLKHKLKYPKA